MNFFLYRNIKKNHKLGIKRSILLCQCRLSWAAHEWVWNKLGNKLANKFRVSPAWSLLGPCMARSLTCYIQFENISIFFTQQRSLPVLPYHHIYIFTDLIYYKYEENIRGKTTILLTSHSGINEPEHHIYFNSKHGLEW